MFTPFAVHRRQDNAAFNITHSISTNKGFPLLIFTMDFIVDQLCKFSARLITFQLGNFGFNFISIEIKRDNALQSLPQTLVIPAVHPVGTPCGAMDIRIDD